MEANTTDTIEPEESAERKPYRTPVLTRLGGLKEMTKTVGYRGNRDGGRFPRGFRTSY